MSIGVTTLFYNRQILEYSGASGLAAFVLVQYFLIFVSQIMMGMATGAQTIFSYNHGSGDNDRVQGTLKRVMGAGLGISTIFFLLIHWQTQGLVGVFIPDDPEVFAEGVTGILVLIFLWKKPVRQISRSPKWETSS